MTACNTRNADNSQMLDPFSLDRLKRWREVGDGHETYTAGSKQFADDVIVLLVEVERLRADNADLHRLNEQTIAAVDEAEAAALPTRNVSNEPTEHEYRKLSDAVKRWAPFIFDDTLSDEQKDALALPSCHAALPTDEMVTAAEMKMPNLSRLQIRFLFETMMGVAPPQNGLVGLPLKGSMPKPVSSEAGNDEIAGLPYDEAAEIVDRIQAQNWKNGGVHVMDREEAIALIAALPTSEPHDSTKPWPKHLRDAADQVGMPERVSSNADIVECLDNLDEIAADERERKNYARAAYIDKASELIGRLLPSRNAGENDGVDTQADLASSLLVYIDHELENVSKHGCHRCWSDDFGKPCTCETERSFIRRSLTAMREIVVQLPSPTVPIKPVLPQWRHKKRGTIYTEIGRGFAQVSVHPIEECTAVVVYRGERGDLWVRNAVEFDDGRFEPLPSPPDSGTLPDGSLSETRGDLSPSSILNARDEALEECAEIAEKTGEANKADKPHAAGIRFGAKIIAEAIRALKSRPSSANAGEDSG
jgi:hypothetical protein